MTSAVNSPTDQPLISVVMTTYNGDKFLIEQLDSLLAQIYPRIEIIICDDNSTDATLSILKSYEERVDSGITVYCNEENIGYVKNFQKSISHCNGDYLVFCDQDDIWEPDKVAEQYRALDEAKALAVYSDAFLVDANGRDLNMSLWEAVLDGIPPKEIDYRAFYITNCVTGCTLMIHRQLLDAALPLPKSVPHDWWLAYHAAYQERLVYTDKKLLHYRQHAGNVYGVGSKIRKKRLSYYLKNKIQKWKLFSNLHEVLKSVVVVKARLQAMYDFEERSGTPVSEELIYLMDWLDDKAMGKDMSKYQAFFQSNSPAFQLLSGKRGHSENITYYIKSILLRFLRRVLTVIFCSFLIVQALYNLSA
tara:strand:+ start:1171 stop:2256 length:1086 start_codon:yes stop_codon:yes gene_type:complete